MADTVILGTPPGRWNSSVGAFDLAMHGCDRSTAQGWLRRDYQPVVTADVRDMDPIWCEAELLRLRQRNRTLAAVIRGCWPSCGLWVAP